MGALNAILAAGVVIAGVVLCETAAIRRAQLIIAGLTAYGAAAFLHAMLTGIALGAALTGHGLFQKLPYVLQGAFLGGFVILPLGWIASIVRAGIPRFREGSLQGKLYQAVALTTCVAVLFTSLPQQSAGPSRLESRATHPQSRAADPQSRVAALDRTLRAIEDGQRDAPRDRWDPDYVVKLLGRDPQQLFAWVRDNTYWIPYRGVLRGPIGVLMDRQGNSLDRSLLLASLLEKAGQPVRLAHVELTQQQALDLLPTLSARRRAYFSVPSQLQPAANPVVQTVADRAVQTSADAGVQTVVAQYQPVADVAGGAFHVKEEAITRMASELDARVADQTKLLLAAVERPDREKDRNLRLQAATSALRDHWWVQRQDGQTWVDLDLLGEPRTGAPLAAAKETTAVNDVAAEQRHEISVRVIAEQWSDGTLTERKALDYALRPADVIGRPIVLQFWPTAWLDDSKNAETKRELRSAAEQDQWAAVLLVGRDVVANSFLVETGNDTNTKGGPMGGLGSAISGALANGGARKSGELSAVWLEYEIRVPGETPRRVRRTVFDLLGPAARAATRSPALALDSEKKLTRGLALMMRTEILPIGCQVAPEFIAHLTAQSFIANRNLLTAIARNDFAVDAKTPGQKPSDPQTPEQQLAAAAPPVSPLLPLAFARFQLSSSSNPVFLSRPNILTRHLFFVPTGAEISSVDATDIVANEVGVDAGSPDAFAARLEQGVLDTNVEAHVGFGPVTGNVAEAFAVSRDWLTITPGHRSGLDSLALPNDVRRRIIEDLDSGYVVVAPKAPVQGQGEMFAGWWRINPLTGDALGMDARGWGDSLVSYSRLARLAVTWFAAFFWEYGLCQAFGQAINFAKVLNEEIFGGWHPSWTTVSKSQSAWDVAKDNNRMCLMQAVAVGCLATLPLLLLPSKLLKPISYKTTSMLPKYVGENLPGNSIWGGKTVKYLSNSERAAYKLEIRNGKIYDSSGHLFDTRGAATAHSGSGRAIFVMDEHGSFYASDYQEVGAFHHSSLAAGQPVAAAGELQVEDGVLKLISDRSGHYQPSRVFTQQALDSLKRSAIDVTSILRDFIGW